MASLFLENGERNEHAVAEDEQNWRKRLAASSQIDVACEQRSGRDPPKDQRSGLWSRL
jgi:hypothetical protein